ncbi:MAG: phospholipase D-like domain-containing protein [Helicobacteraceae bacterium]
MKALLLLWLAVAAFAGQKVYFMPAQAQEAKSVLLSAINGAASSIDIAMYSFTHKNFAKALKNAAARGVAVRIITDFKDADRNTQVGYLAKYQNVQAFTLDGERARSGKYSGKMHLKTAVIDGKISIYGSANWTNSAFGLNYEFLMISDDPSLAQEFKQNYRYLLQNAKKF